MTELDRGNQVATRRGVTTIVVLWPVLAASVVCNVIAGLGLVNHLLQPVFGVVAVAAVVLLIVAYRRRRKLR